MDIRSLRYFQTVAECGSFSRGSELLRISQPAVSRTIHELENELGCKLFNRIRTGVSLTDLGQQLLERSQFILHDVERLKQDIVGGGNGPAGVVSIAIPPAVGHLMLPPLAKALQKKAPNISLRIFGGFSGYIKELMVKGQVDLACIHDPVSHRGVDIKKMVREEVFVVGKAGAFGDLPATIRSSALLQLPLVLPARPNVSRRLLDRWAEPSDIALHPKFEVDDHMMIRALVESGLGFALLTKSAISGELAAGTVEARPLAPRAFWPLALMIGTRQARSDSVTVVVETVLETVETLLAEGKWIGAQSDNDKVS